jgi:two-component system OmpR family response regulator
LPDMAGYDICKDIRSSGSEVPILILTGNKDLGSRVGMLNAGADDYLVKPFSVAELRARLNALLRRAPAKFGPDMLAVQDLVLDPNRREVERGGKRITLRRKEFDILEYLVRNKGRAVTRSMIFDHVWESTSEKWSNTVDVHIKYLRDKIDRPFAVPLIKTAYGVGYMIDDVNVTKKRTT